MRIIASTAVARAARLSTGSRSFRRYLDDIRLTRIRPFAPLLLRVHVPRKAIVFSAAAFGLMHLPGIFAGTAPLIALGQVVWAFLFGLFYGYIFLKSGSLLPSMVIHWLSNVFQASLTAYFATASAPVRALYGVVFGYGLAAVLMMLWVRFFAARWLPPQASAGPPAPA